MDIKDVLKIIGVLAIYATFNACTQQLEETPSGVLSPETFFNSEAAFEAALVGAYRPLYGEFNGFDFFLPIAAGFGADDVRSLTDSGSYDTFSETTNNRVNNTLWKIFYASITNANTIISNSLKVSSIPKNKIDSFVGQAKFLRAFSYFFLTRYFGQVPLIIFENQSKASTTGQSKEKAIYDFIITDLKEAEKKLPVSFPEKGRATKGAAKTLLAKVYLTMAGWPIEDQSKYALARDKAKEVMDMTEYQLETDFANLWKSSYRFNNKEAIFSFFGIASQGWIPGSHLHLASRPNSEGGWANFHSEDRFFQAYPAGYRKDVSFHTTFLNGANYKAENPKEPFIAKFRDAGSACGPEKTACSGDGESAFMIFRYAEVLLIYAEAANMAEGAPSSKALEELNRVRRRANKLPIDTPNTSVDLPSGMSKSAFDKAVIEERAWELAFENKRWFDLVRKKMVVEVNKTLHPNVSINNRLIPKPALQVNLTKGLEQNTGY